MSCACLTMHRRRQRLCAGVCWRVSTECAARSMCEYLYDKRPTDINTHHACAHRLSRPRTACILIHAHTETQAFAYITLEYAHSLVRTLTHGVRVLQIKCRAICLNSEMRFTRVHRVSILVYVHSHHVHTASASASASQMQYAAVRKGKVRARISVELRNLYDMRRQRRRRRQREHESLCVHM